MVTMGNDLGFEIKLGEGIFGKAAEVKVGKYYLRVIPGAEKVGNGYNVLVFGDDGHGQADTASEPLGGIKVSGGPDDVGEIADTYARRLQAGIPPERLFDDIRESALDSMRRILAESGKTK